MSNTKLPALPPHPAIRDGITWRDDERKAIDEYARAAILADRERQAGEAVAWHVNHNGSCQIYTTREAFDPEGCIVTPLFASLPAPQAVQAGWKQIGWTCDEGACGRIHDEPSTADPEFTQPVFVRTAAPSPDGKAEQAEAPSDHPQFLLRKCEHCGCETNAKMRACCRAGWVDDKVASEDRASLVTQPTASTEQAEAPSDVADEFAHSKTAPASRPEFVSLEEHDRILQAVRQPTASNAGEREE